MRELGQTRRNSREYTINVRVAGRGSRMTEGLTRRPAQSLLPAQPRQVRPHLATLRGFASVKVRLLREAQRVGTAFADRVMSDRELGVVDALMDARRAVKHAKQSNDAAALADARRDVDAAKHALGERGPVWWTDGAPDYNRHLVKNSPYAAWYVDREAPRS